MLSGQKQHSNFDEIYQARRKSGKYLKEKCSPGQIILNS